MPVVGAWCKIWIYFGFVFGWSKAARPRFDSSTDMNLVLIPADAEVDSVIFRLRATDQDADFPLVFEITATITPVVRIENLPCTLYNKVCQANVILTKRLIPGRLHDFAVRVRDTKGDSNSMQATISVTNATTQRDKIFPHIPSLIMVPEDTKPGKELDYLLVRANSWSGKPVYIELWQPKELFTIRQRQTPTQTRGIITLIGELDFETQSMYTLTMYATDPYTEPGKDTRNIAGLNVVVVVQDVQDVPPIFTLAPPLTRINNSMQPGDVILRVHAEDGDKGVPREIAYGLVSEGNPFTPFFNISETTGEITLARPLEELTQITHVGAPVVLTVVAEEIRRSKEEPPVQATVVEVGFLLGEPGNSPPYFESENYVATVDENLEPGTVIMFGEQFSTRVRDEDIGKAGVFALKLENNNGTFEINPTVAERTADFIITVRDNTLIDYDLYKSLSFKITAQEVGPATNLSASAPVVIFLRDVNDNPPVFDEESYEVTLSENVTAGTRVVQVHATDKDTGSFGNIRYTGITGEGSDAFVMDSDTGLITVAMGSSLDREIAPKLLLSVEARDEDGKGNRGTVPLIVNLLDVNDNAPLFDKEVYEFTLNSELTNFTTPAVIKAIDADAEPPNNEVRYELIHGNYENKFQLDEITGELFLRSPVTKVRRKKQSEQFAKKFGTGKLWGRTELQKITPNVATILSATLKPAKDKENETDIVTDVQETTIRRRKRADDDALYTLTARAYDLGVPHLSSVTQIRILSGVVGMEARIVMFVVPGEHPDLAKTTETLSTITGGRITVLETRPYVAKNQSDPTHHLPGGSKKSIVVARVEQTESGTALVDIEKIRDYLAANGVGIINGSDAMTHVVPGNVDPKTVIGGDTADNGQTTNINSTIIGVHNEEVTVYKAENKLLIWLLVILALLMLIAIAVLIICCICPGCPFYMAPRKRRVHSSETLIVRDGRPKRHLQRKPAAAVVETAWNGRKQAWSADPTRRNWQFNRRNTKNCGLASLPGDVAYISGQTNDVQVNVESLRARDGPIYDSSRRIDEHERMYVDDMESQKMRGYDGPEMDSMRRHELERGSDAQRQDYRQRSDSRYVDAEMPEGTTVREQHFYREGNAEVLRLVTRGQVEDSSVSHHYHHRQPTTLIVDGKEILLRRFMEDQTSRHDHSLQELELARSMESHQRAQDASQQQQPPEVILIPERLDLDRMQHEEEIGPTVQRLVIDHGAYSSPRMEAKETQIRGTPRRLDRQERHDRPAEEPRILDRASVTKEHMQSTNVQPFSFHDLELARQNALLTRLLLEREGRHGIAGVADTTSYLETQSLPGQVAIATQTDRTTATQTDRHVRSRSDNDESDDDSKYRKKLKFKKRYGDGDWRRTRSLWMKSPIEEEDGPCFDKRLSILRKKVKEVKEGRKVPLEPEVLREISDSLEENGSSYPAEEEEATRTYQRSTEQTSIKYKVLNEEENESRSSMEMDVDDNYERIFGEKTVDRRRGDRKADVTESTSSPETRGHREAPGRGKSDGKSPKKEGRTRAQRKFDGVMKPTFRILEREITMLTKKLSKMGDKKPPESSDSTSQDKPSSSKDSKNDTDQPSFRKIDTSSSRAHAQSSSVPSTSKSPSREQTDSQRKEAAITKTRQKLKYQQSQVMSTGSSEYDDSFEKATKQSPEKIQDSKHKQAVSQAKTRRPTHPDHREGKKQSSSEQESAEKRKEKPGRIVRAPKLASIARKENVIEEQSVTSASSEKTAGKKVARRDSEKRETTESSSGNNGSDEAKRAETGEQVSEQFSDHFVKEPRRLRQSTVTAARAEKRKRREAADLEKFAEDKLGDEMVQKSEERRLRDGPSPGRVTEQSVEAKKIDSAAMASDGVRQDEGVSVVTESIQAKWKKPEMKLSAVVPESDHTSGEKISEMLEKDKTETEAQEDMGEGGEALEDSTEKCKETIKAAGETLIASDTSVIKNGEGEAEASTRDTVTPKSILDDVGVQMDKVKEKYKDMDASSSEIKDEDKSDPVYTAPDTKKEEESVELWREESNEELKKEELIEPPKKKKHDMPEQFEQVQEPRVSIEAKTEEEEGRITEEEGKDSKIEQEGTEGLSIQDLSTKDIKVEDIKSPEQTKGEVSTQIDKKKEMFSEASVTQTKEEKLGSPETEEASQIVKLEKDASELHEKEQTTETTTLEKEKFEFREKDEASEIAQLEREGAESPETEEPSQIEKLEKETLESHQKEEISETVHLETKQAEPSKVEKANQIAKLEKKELELPEKESVSKTSQLEREKTESPKKNEVEQIAKLEKEELESPEKEELSKIAQLETEEIESPQKQEAHPTVKLEKEQLEPREPNEISQTVHLDRKQTKSPEKEEVDQTAKLENEELESPEREELSKIAHLEREETRSPEKEELDQTAKLDKEKLESREQEEITETTHLAKEEPQSSDNEETNQITKLKNEELESREEENGSQSAKLETLKSPEKKEDEMFLDASSKQVESLVPEEHEQIHKLSPAAEEATKEKDFKKDALNGKQEEDFAIPEIREPIAKDNQLLGTEKDIVIVKPDEHSTVDKEAVATAQLDSAQVHLTPTRFGSVRDKEPDKEDTLEEKEQDSVDRTESQILDVVGLSEKEKEKQLIVSKDEERKAKDLTPEGGEPVKKETTESEKHTKKEEVESGINKEEARTEEREELIISDDDKKTPTVEESEEYQKKGEKETPVIKDTTKQDAASDVEAKELIKEPKDGKEKCESEVDVTEKEDVPKVGIVKQEDDAVKTSVLLDVTKKEPSIQEVTKDEPEDSKTGDESKVDVIKKEDQAVATAITPGVTEEKPLVEELKKDELESSKTEDERNISLPIDERIVKKSSNFLDDSQTSVTHVDEPSRVQQLTVTDSEEGNIIEDSTSTAETKIPESVPIGADDDEALRDKFSKAMPEITPQGNVKAEEKIDSTEELSVPQETKSDELAKEATEKPQEIETHKTTIADKVTVSKEAGKDESATDKSVDTETPSKDEEISKELEWHHDFVKDSTRLMIESERAHMKEVDSFFKQQVDSLSKEIPDKPKKCDESAEPVAEIQQEHKLPGSSDVQESVKDKILKEDEGCEKAVIKSVEDVTVKESPITAELAKSVSTKDEEQKFESTAPPKEAVQETVTISESKVQSEPKDKQNETQIAGQFTDQRVVLTDEDTSHRPVDEKFLSDPNSRQILPDESTLSIEETVEGKTRIQERLKDKRDELSVPLFSTNIIDTLDDSDESDSSSDISRKTTLTTGPYQTPRHRSKSSSGAELVESMGEKAEVQSLHSEEETWAVELDESTTRELPENRGEREKEDDKDEENTKMKEINLEKHTVDSKTGGSVDNLHSVSLQPKKPVKTSPKGKLEASKHDKSSRPTVGRSGTTRNGKEFKSDSIAKEKRDEPRGIKAEAGKSVSNTKKQDEKGESSKTGTKPKQPEKLRSQRRKKGNSTDETSDEKSTHPKERGQRRAQPPSTSDRSGPQEIDQVKRRSSDQARESKKAEKPQEKLKRKESLTRPKEKASSGSEKSSSPPKTGDIDTSKAQPKYMAWYKKKREEMERRRAEVKEDEEQLPRWLRKGRKSKSDKTEKRKEQKTPETTPRTRRKVKPLVNVESEQLKAIVRQGRKLRRAEGGGNEDPPVQIFATTPPAAPDPKHHLLQHSQYKYEKIQPPFYLHPPPAPHSSPQLSPQHFEAEPRETTEHRHLEDQFDPGIGIPIQTTGRLRHQQLLEKKSVFDIAYSEAAPPQLRSDSTTPPS